MCVSFTLLVYAFLYFNILIFACTWSPLADLLISKVSDIDKDSYFYHILSGSFELSCQLGLYLGLPPCPWPAFLPFGPVLAKNPAKFRNNPPILDMSSIMFHLVIFYALIHSFCSLAINPQLPFLYWKESHFSLLIAIVLNKVYLIIFNKHQNNLFKYSFTSMWIATKSLSQAYIITCFLSLIYHLNQSSNVSLYMPGSFK